jgi:hypothetical protein
MLVANMETKLTELAIQCTDELIELRREPESLVSQAEQYYSMNETERRQTVGIRNRANRQLRPARSTGK